MGIRVQKTFFAICDACGYHREDGGLNQNEQVTRYKEFLKKQGWTERKRDLVCPACSLELSEKEFLSEQAGDRQ